MSESLKEAEHRLIMISQRIEGPIKGGDLYFDESDHYWVLAALSAVREKLQAMPATEAILRDLLAGLENPGTGMTERQLKERILALGITAETVAGEHGKI